jgi:hypothetical protein
VFGVSIAGRISLQDRCRPPPAQEYLVYPGRGNADGEIKGNNPRRSGRRSEIDQPDGSSLETRLGAGGVLPLCALGSCPPATRSQLRWPSLGAVKPFRTGRQGRPKDIAAASVVASGPAQRPSDPAYPVSSR